MNTNEAIADVANVVVEIVKSIASDHKVADAAHKFIVTTAQEGAHITGAGILTIFGAGNLSAAVAAAGEAIHVAASGVWHAVMSTSLITNISAIWKLITAGSASAAGTAAVAGLATVASAAAPLLLGTGLLLGLRWLFKHW